MLEGVCTMIEFTLSLILMYYSVITIIYNELSLQNSMMNFLVTLRGSYSLNIYFLHFIQPFQTKKKLFLEIR